MTRHKSSFHAFSERFSHQATLWAGSTWAFMIALAVLIVWGFTGPIFSFSDTWQLIINTGTTIVTFLMVFLIQRSQNKESEAVQIKLNEILAAMEGASNRLINIEDMSEEEIHRLHACYQKLATAAREAGELCATHTIEEAMRCAEVEEPKTLAPTAGTQEE